MKHTEIRFRAWSGRTRTMFNIFSLSRTGTAICLSPDGRTFGSTIDEKEFVVMQNTGLMDKKGREIFEGDILRYNWPEAPDCCVIFEEGCFWIKDPSLIGREAYLQEVNEESEVIGNIHEHPHLLKNSARTLQAAGVEG